MSERGATTTDATKAPVGDQFFQGPLVALARSDVGPTTRLVYFALLAFARSSDTCRLVAEVGLAEQAGVSVRTLRRAIHELEQIRWVELVRVQGQPHLYRILGPRARSRAGPAPPANLAGTPASFVKTPASLAGDPGQKCSQTPAKLADKIHGRTDMDHMTHMTVGRNTDMGAPAEKSGGARSTAAAQDGAALRARVLAEHEARKAYAARRLGAT